MKKIILTLSVLTISIFVFSQIPSKPQTQAIALVGGTAHLGNGEVIENSTVVFNNGKIIFVGKASDAKYDQRTTKAVNVNGKHIYPGFIAPSTPLGLTEIGAARATLDHDEVGEYNPNVRSLIAYNTDSKIIPTIRSNGVLLAQTAPQAGVICGSSSIMELDGWNWEDAVYKTDDGLFVNFPKLLSFNWNWLDEEEGKISRNKKRDDQLNQLKQFFTEAKAYCNIPHEKKNLKFEAMRGVFEGKQKLFINSDYSKDIVEAVNFAKEMSIPKIVITGGKDALKVADFLKTNNVSVILFRIHSLPHRVDEDIDMPYKTPYLLQKAGVLFCLSYEGGKEATGIRNLPFLAGTAAAYGLTKEEALMTITSNTAKILGIDNTVGTIETGKDATIIVSTGDALDMRTNNIEIAFIRGKMIDLNDKQKELYKKYSEKYWGKETK